MKALVTGMSGFVGGHLVQSLLRDGIEVHGTIWPSIATGHPPQAHGYVVDVTDRLAVLELIRDVGPEVVYHLAGAASVGASFADPAGTWRVNLEGTRAVLDAMRQAAPDARLVVALSGEEYGRVRAEELPVTESTPMQPLSPYAESKKAADYLCAEYQSKYRLAVIRLRAFNQLGPGQDARFVLPSICKQIADAELAGASVCRLHLGNLDTRRDFLDVRDVVAAYRLLAQHGDPARAYLAGAGRSVSIRELVSLAVSMATIPVEVLEDRDRVREGEQPDLYADPEALLGLGWVPRLSLGQSIADTLSYWRERAHMEVG